MAFIYKIVNDINEKIYVGKTTSSIEERFKEHCKDCLRTRKEKRPLYDAMQKYGKEHFQIILLEECSVDILNDRENIGLNIIIPLNLGIMQHMEEMELFFMIIVN